jgi:hypothetical protein
MSDYYDRDGRPIGMMEWGRLLDNLEYRVIEKTLVRGRWEVSTVWMGLDHSFGQGPPLIFETMVFDQNAGDASDHEMRRYATEQQARDGHAEMVWLVTQLEDVNKG